MKAILISLLSASIFGILLLSIQAIFQGGPLISNLLIFLLCIFVGSIAFAIPIAREWITLRKTIGLRDVYRNIAVCEKTIKKRLESANNVEIFMQIGKSFFSGRESLVDFLKENVPKSCTVKILYASVESPYLSRERATDRKSNYEEWMTDVEYVGSKLSKAENIDIRTHKEGFFFRFIIIDDEIFLQPYLFPKNNSTLAPVLVIGAGKGEKATLYTVFERYFKVKWAENERANASVAHLLGQEQVVTVSIFLRFKGKHVFVIPKRYVKDDITYFHAPGGKVKAREALVEALQREVREELDTGFKIDSASETHLVTSFGFVKKMQLSDDPSPVLFYRKTSDEDPNFSSGETSVMATYRGELDPDARLRASNETAAILLLDAAQYERALSGELHVRDLRVGEGIIANNGLAIAPDAQLVPRGAAVHVGRMAT